MTKIKKSKGAASKRQNELKPLTDEQRRMVVEHVFGFRGPEKSFKEVAKVMHVQVARIREIYNKALNKMEMVQF